MVTPALQDPLEELIDQTIVPSAERYVGEKRGIQGNHNSCYLDATLFGLFALSNVFDSVLLGVAMDKQHDDSRQAVSELLTKGIVNPLRKLVNVAYIHAQ